MSAASAGTCPAAQDAAAGAAAWYLERQGVFNRCNRTPWSIAAQSFQSDPAPLELRWVREEHGDFLARIGTIPDPSERCAIFHDYCLARFWLHEPAHRWPPERMRRRRSYLGVLSAWSADSASHGGAVLKGWAESRFGLRVIHHGGRLDAGADAMALEAARLHGATYGVLDQLDLLHAFAQDELARRRPGSRWLTLHRGTHDADAYRVHGGDGHTVEFDAISSFTDDPEVAWEFGSRVWDVRVPLAKIVCWSGVFGAGVLQGESEYLVLGGDYRVSERRW